MSEPSTGITSFLTPDFAAAVSLGTFASLVSALQSNVKGYGVLVSNMAAAIVTAVVLPLALRQGFTWGDWLGCIVVVCGISASGVFLMVSRVMARLLSHSDDVADGLFNRYWPFGKKKEDKP